MDRPWLMKNKLAVTIGAKMGPTPTVVDKVASP